MTYCEAFIKKKDDTHTIYYASPLSYTNWYGEYKVGFVVAEYADHSNPMENYDDAYPYLLEELNKLFVPLSRVLWRASSWRDWLMFKLIVHRLKNSGGNHIRFDNYDEFCKEYYYPDKEYLFHIDTNLGMIKIKTFCGDKKTIKEKEKEFKRNLGKMEVIKI